MNQTVEQAYQTIVDTKDDFIIGSAIAQLAVKTPGVIYRSQSRMDATVRMLGELSESDKELVAAGATSMLADHYRTIMNDDSRRVSGVVSADIAEKNGPFEKMKACFEIMRYDVEIPDDVQQAIEVLEHLDPQELRKLLGRMVDETASLEVLTNFLTNNREGTVDAMRIAHQFIPENASIRMSALVFMVGAPETGVVSRAKVYRAGAIPAPAFSNVEETLGSVSHQAVVSSARQYLAQIDNSPATDRFWLMNEPDTLIFKKTKAVISSVARSIMRAHEQNDNLLDEIYSDIDGMVEDEQLDTVVNNAVDSLLSAHGPENPNWDRVLRDFENGDEHITQRMMEALAQSRLDPASLDLSNEVVGYLLEFFAADNETLEIDGEAMAKDVVAIIRRGEPKLLEQPDIDVLAEANKIVSSIFDTMSEMANTPETERDSQPSM